MYVCVCMGFLHSERWISIVANQLLSGMVSQETWTCSIILTLITASFPWFFPELWGTWNQYTSRFLEAPRHEHIQESSSDNR